MQEISRFYDIIIKMIHNDSGEQQKPHILAYYGEHEASIGLDGEMLEGTMPVKQFRIISGWMAIHEDELYAAWNNTVRQQPVDKIEPLK